MRKWLPASVFAASMLAVPAVAGAAEVPPALVHATPVNECKLNVRAGADVGSGLLATLTCMNYTTCVHAESPDTPCGPYVTGGVYTCVGADNTKVTDNRWAEVGWRYPQKSYVAVGCAAFARVTG